MKKIFNSSLLSLLSFAFILGCASGGSKGKVSDFQMRKFKEQVLPNGLTLILIEDTALPKVTLSMIFKAGLLNEGEKSGLNALASELTERGTAKRSAKQIADEFGQLGTSLSIAAGEDYVQFSSSSLTQNASELLNVFSDVILKPAFSENELRKLKMEVGSRLKQESDDASVVVGRSFDRELYGNHPYAHPVATTESLNKISRTDVIRHYSKYYRPNNAYLAVVGNFSPEFVTQVTAAFSAWDRRAIDVPMYPALKEAKFDRAVLIAKPGLKQAQIAMGHLGIKRKDPDFLALRTGSLILGGAFASRLNQKIRDDLGLTYNINASFDPGLDLGVFKVRTFTRQEKTTEVIVEAKKVVAEFVKDGITDKELKSAKALLMGQFPSSVETPEMLASRLIGLRVYGVGDEYLKDFLTMVNKLTVDDVNKAIRKHVHPDNIQVVVHADETALPESFGKTFNPLKKEYVP